MRDDSEDSHDSFFSCEDEIAVRAPQESVPQPTLVGEAAPRATASVISLLSADPNLFDVCHRHVCLLTTLTRGELVKRPTVLNLTQFMGQSKQCPVNQSYT